MDRNQSRKIKSDETLISILNILKSRETSQVSEIADELGIANSTVHGHLATLRDHGLVRKSGTEYGLGLMFLDYGEEARRRHPLYHVTADILEKLAERTEEKIWCIVESNGKAVYLNSASGDRSVKTHAREGQHTDLHHLAAGKAILASLPSDRVEAIIENSGLPALTPHTITDKAQLLDELEDIQDEGVAFNREESVIGLHAVGAAIHNEEDRVIGAISVSAPSNRMDMGRMSEEMTPELKGTVNEIEISFRTGRY